MSNPSKYLETLIKIFSRLPGIGPKSAARLAFHILKMPEDDVRRLSTAIMTLKTNIKPCRICGSLSDSGLCSICSDETRDHSLICIVESQSDVISIEKTGEFKGVFHVLGGLISPLDGIGPEDLGIDALLQRCSDEDIKEIIIAMNPTIEGDATRLYITKLLKPVGIKIMRIAHGLPIGSNLEFADSATIAQSIRDRIEVD